MILKAFACFNVVIISLMVQIINIIDEVQQFYKAVVAVFLYVSGS